MIQRIQTVYLFLAALACFLLFAIPFASVDENIQASVLFADSRYTIQDNALLILTFVLAGAFAFFAIFLFKNRPLQRNMSRVAFVFTLVGVVLAIIFFTQDEIMKAAQAIQPSDGIGIFLPVLTIIFLILAIRGINKDDKLVKSSSRLRD